MRVPVTDLVGKPGSTRLLQRAVTRTDMGEAGYEWGPAEETVTSDLQLDVTLEAVVEGILVRGTVDVDLTIPCSRCLVDQHLEHTAAIAELFMDPRRIREDEADDEDVYLIDADLAALDLGPLLRDTVVMEIPVQLLCRPECQGLCPVCGTDRNERDCGHRQEAGADPRWAKLADLDLPPG